MSSDPGPGRTRQTEIYVRGVGGERPLLTTDPSRLEAAALALGATAVGVGRPYVWALALAGEAGVAELLRNLVAEMDLTLGLTGRRGVAELDASVLTRGDG